MCPHIRADHTSKLLVQRSKVQSVILRSFTLSPAASNLPHFCLHKSVISASREQEPPDAPLATDPSHSKS